MSRDGAVLPFKEMARLCSGPWKMVQGLLKAGLERTVPRMHSIHSIHSMVLNVQHAQQARQKGMNAGGSLACLAGRDTCAHCLKGASSVRQRELFV